MNKENLPNMVCNAKIMVHALEEVEAGIPVLDLCRKRNYWYHRVATVIRQKISSKEMSTFVKVLEEVLGGKTQAAACRKFNVDYTRFNRFVNNGTFDDIEDPYIDWFYIEVLGYFYGEDNSIVITNRLRKIIDDFCKEDLSPVRCQIYQCRLIDHFTMTETEEYLRSNGMDCNRFTIRVYENKFFKKAKLQKLHVLIEDYLQNYIPDAKCVIG